MKKIKNIPDPVYSVTLEETKKVRTILIKHIQDQLPDNLVEGFQIITHQAYFIYV